VEELLEIDGIGREKAEQIIGSAKHYVQVKADEGIEEGEPQVQKEEDIKEESGGEG
jgi:hypothetical protein